MKNWILVTKEVFLYLLVVLVIGLLFLPSIFLLSIIDSILEVKKDLDKGK